MWVALGWFGLGVLTMIGSYPGKFFTVVFNNLWATVYVTALNFILFEYSVPFVLKKRKIFIYNILAGLLLLWVYMMLFSFGSYAWRFMGIQLHVFTELKIFPSIDNALANQMGEDRKSVV